MRRLDRVLLSPAFTLLLHAAPVEDAQPVAIEPRRDLIAPPQLPDDPDTRTSDDAFRTSDSGLRTRTPHDFGLRTPHFASYYHWHIEIIPRLLPVAGLAWDGGIHINPVPPEEAAQALRDAKP